ncbi:MAG: NIPSNAP family protein [Hyphomonadaceae bacterium]
MSAKRTLPQSAPETRGGVLRRFVLGLAAGGFALLAGCATPAAPGSAETSKPATTADVGIYELRIYSIAPGKTDALNARFRDHTIDLFKKHGMTPIAFFMPVTRAGQPADNRLFYLMGYKDRAARDDAWKAFAADPEWRKVFQESQADGSLTTKIENAFLTPAEYSMALDTKPAAKPRLFELRTYKGMPGKLENIHQRFRDHTIEIFKNHAMTSMIYWRPVPGQPDLDGKMVYLLAFPDLAARDAAWRAFATDPEWQKVSEESQRDGQLLDGAPVSVLLSPTDYSPLR